MSDVTITHQQRGKGGRYLAEVDGSEHTGRLDWEPQGENVRVATHTVVPKAIGGRGIAAQLVEAIVNDAKAHGFRIAPQCSYVAKKFDENSEWAGLRA